jgi:CoA:oxalate CoA-transferase
MARLAPFGTFATRDGYIAICAPVENFALGLYAAMKRPELAQDPRFSNREGRVTNHEALHALVGDWVKTMTTQEAETILADHGVPSGVVREPGEAKRDPNLLARGETVPITHPVYGAVEKDIYGSGLPIIMSGSRVGYDRPPVPMGANNDAVYGGLLGYDKERLDRLKRDKVI